MHRLPPLSLCSSRARFPSFSLALYRFLSLTHTLCLTLFLSLLIFLALRNAVIARGVEPRAPEKGHVRRGCAPSERHCGTGCPPSLLISRSLDLARALFISLARCRARALSLSLSCYLMLSLSLSFCVLLSLSLSLSLCGQPSMHRLRTVPRTCIVRKRLRVTRTTPRLQSLELVGFRLPFRFLSKAERITRF